MPIALAKANGNSNSNVKLIIVEKREREKEQIMYSLREAEIRLDKVRTVRIDQKSFLNLENRSHLQHRDQTSHPPP